RTTGTWSAGPLDYFRRDLTKPPCRVGDYLLQGAGPVWLGLFLCAFLGETWDSGLARRGPGGGVTFLWTRQLIYRKE
ncbi:MAG: hypothetical protein ACYTEQ_24405, partial [Planctomycetota bacterium]